MTRPVLSVRWKARLLAVGAVSAFMLFMFLPFEQMFWGQALLLACGGLSLLVRCPRCRTWAYQRRKRLLGETWSIGGGLLPPPACSVCGQDFRFSHAANASRDTHAQRVEQRSPRKTFIMLLLCAGTAGMSALMAAAVQEWQFLVFASAVTLGWLVAAFVWRRSHPWQG